MNRIDLLGILPYGLITDSLGASVYICEIYDYHCFQINDHQHVYKHLNSTACDFYRSPYLYQGKPMTHNDMYNIIDSYVQKHIRTKKLERICLDSLE